MTTIGIDAREICNRPAGKGQYLLRLIWQWAEDPTLRLILYTQEGQQLPSGLRDREGISQVAQSGRGPLWHLKVGRRLGTDGVGVFFAALSYQSAIFSSRPTVTVVHDLAVFRLPRLAHNRRAWWVERMTLRACCRRSVKIIAVSQATKADLLSLAGPIEAKVEVVYEASLLGESQPPLPFPKRDPFFLFVGTLEPRKNIATLLRAYADLPEPIRSTYRLRLAGKPGWGGEDYPLLAAQLGIKDRVDFLGYVPDSELAGLFRRATLFLFPSHYEGFGLPVVEAMSCGTPVLTSSSSSLPEVVGPQGITCPPTDGQAISRAIERLVTDKELYAQQSRYLYERARQFDWKKIAGQVRDILKEAQTLP